MNIREMLRVRQQCATDAEAARLLGCHRQTVSKYRRWAESEGLFEAELPEEGELHAVLERTMPTRQPPQQTSSLEPHRAQIETWLEAGVRMTTMRRRLEDQTGRPVSYEALRRFARRLKPHEPEVFVRIETEPGEEAQVDFGYAGRQIDPATGELRKAWLFVMVLSHSRHLYAEVVFDQTVRTWLMLHLRSFAFFGGVPRRIVLDNLKSGIAKHSAETMEGQRSYRELAEHCGFLIDPHPPRQPHLKGKVERNVDYVRGAVLAGREPERADRLNAELRQWSRDEAGTRIHGTTRQKPLEVFQTRERRALQPLPATAFDPPTWKDVRLHRDCHVQFERAWYSAPFRYVGQTVRVRGGLRDVRIYDCQTHELIAVHDLAREPGDRSTVTDHLPDTKRAGLELTRANCRCRAEAVGTATLAVVEAMLEHRPEDRLRMAGRLLQLECDYGPERLERACARAQAFAEPQYGTVKRILQRGLDRQAWPSPPRPHAPRTPMRFARRAAEYALSRLAEAGGGAA